MPSLRLLSVEAPGARAQRGSWASCAPQPLASGPKHGQGCSQAGRRRQVGVGGAGGRGGGCALALVGSRPPPPPWHASGPLL